ncbi:hypothetical protein GIB67_036985 [Kingdonia uniflora]|uniref:PDZ domain-containing protein n=1 Tax=Kingdonia uniflora TaxID=39325 RepID=A0A7J7NVU8_9MAGN|nr:hypothetical protein GIB67_036985 [Kingdonia uniflora]
MVAPNLKSQTLSLVDQRDALERQMDDIIARLCNPGGPGMSGNLVDSEGFPRSDIDIPAVRADRQRLNELRSDYKNLTDRISESLELLHTGKAAHEISSMPRTSGIHFDEGIKAQEEEVAEEENDEGNEEEDGDSSDIESVEEKSIIEETVTTETQRAMDVDRVVSVPFAMVDEIADSSPAAEDGLQLGDRIMKFGNVESGENLLQKLASESQTNEGRSVPLVIQRQGEVINLTLTPRQWIGRGLLGYVFHVSITMRGAMPFPYLVSSSISCHRMKKFTLIRAKKCVRPNRERYDQPILVASSNVHLTDNTIPEGA